jgi:hypothetical protein
MQDPEPPECAGCLRLIAGPNLWLCDECVSTAVELGLEAEPSHHPGDEVVKILWEKAKERQCAKITRRDDEEAGPQGSA